MQSYLEQLLSKKNEKNGEDELFLYTQWHLTKTFIPKVQAVISHIFPHFSLHDDTHSETILSRIESLLGKEELEKLSVTDIWLMLSAAYYHDVGMAMMADDIEKIFAEEKFQAHVKKIQSDTSHPLHCFADLFEVREDGIYYNKEKLCGKTFDAARFLLADYVRKIHHERSRNAISADNLLHLKGSPIPVRLVDYLGRICESHNMSFNEVMKLPKTEMGVYGDTCHPRFISCMLRLGDLLDLDNNRFSDVLLNTLSQIPEDSLNHKKKHLGIKHFFLDNKHLELDAVCHDYDVYDITYQWFSMIKDEIGWQKGNWTNIVPEGITSSLPVIDQLDIRLLDYDIIDEKGKPGFTIETTKAMQLFQGAGIYQGEASCIRELLQNSVDASNISLYLDSVVDGFSITTPQDLYQACQRRPIKVSLMKDRVTSDFAYWKIVIEDNGLGMSKEDIKYLMQTGSRNGEKQEIVDKMPEIAKPSGSFGIGFQSVFMMTDEVNIESWKQNTNSHLEATLFNPTGPRKGRVVVKSDDGNAGKHGTIVSFVYKVENIPSRITYSAEMPFSTQVASSYDFVTDESLDYKIARVVEEIQRFGANSQCPILLSIEGNSPIDLRQKEHGFAFYSKECGVQLNVYDGVQYMSRVFYRNQLVKLLNTGLVDFLAVDIDILSGEAKDILTLSRTEIRHDYLQQLTEITIKAVTEYLVQRKWKREEKQMQALAAMFLRQYHTDKELLDLNVGWLENWCDYTLMDDKKTKTTFRSIVKDSKSATVRIIETRSAADVSFKGKDRKTVSIEMNASSRDITPLYFLLNKLLKTHPFVVYTSFEDGGEERVCYELTKSNRPLIENWKRWFIYFKAHSFSARQLIPCNEKYAALKVKRDKYWSVAWTFPWKMDVPLMICPYIIKRGQPDLWGLGAPSLVWDDCDEKLYKIVFEHRADPDVTIEQIRETYKVFKSDTEAFI